MISGGHIQVKLVKISTMRGLVGEKVNHPRWHLLARKDVYGATWRDITLWLFNIQCIHLCQLELQFLVTIIVRCYGADLMLLLLIVGGQFDVILVNCVQNLELNLSDLFKLLADSLFSIALIWAVHFKDNDEIYPSLFKSLYI